MGQELRILGSQRGWGCGSHMALELFGIFGILSLLGFIGTQDLALPSSSMEYLGCCCWVRAGIPIPIGIGMEIPVDVTPGTRIRLGILSPIPKAFPTSRIPNFFPITSRGKNSWKNHPNDFPWNTISLFPARIFPQEGQFLKKIQQKFARMGFSLFSSISLSIPPFSSFPH